MFDVDQCERLVQKFEPGSALLRAWKLAGGVSAQVTAFEIERPDGGTHRLIVRRHGRSDRQRNPRIAADEFALLRIMHAAGLATPIPYHLDESGEIFDTPYVVLEYVEGEPEFTPANLHGFTDELAAHLARIHALDCSQFDLSFLPRQAERYAGKIWNRPAIVDDSCDEGRVRAALEAVWPLPQHNRSALLHGDYWPGNIVWRDGRLAAVIDWEDAEVGDPLADVGNTRLELLWAFGADAMLHFTQTYQSSTALDLTNLPYWDLCAALRPASKFAEWAGDAVTEARMRERHGEFVAQAFGAIAALP